MAKVKTTVYVDEKVMHELRVAAARANRPISEVVEDAMREATLSGMIERIQARGSDLSEEEALELAYSELHAMRRERAAAARR